VAIPLHSLAVARPAPSTWREYSPAPAAGPAIERAWIGFGGFDHSIMLAPDGCADLVWNGTVLAASLPRAGGMRRRVKAANVNVGVRIACGWAGVLFGPALERAAGAEVDLSILWGALGEEAAVRLRRTEDPGVARSVLEALVAERLAGRRPPSPDVLEAVRLLRRDPGLALDSLGRRVDTPARTLRRRIVGATGLSPKRLQRVFRFQALRRRLQAADAAEPAAGLAADLGFADQAHMTRECRAMTGRTPTELRRAA
jgi:AraC-like DNA-binding protein